jgi:hypothetical protein
MFQSWRLPPVFSEQTIRGELLEAVVSSSPSVLDDSLLGMAAGLESFLPRHRSCFGRNPIGSVTSLTTQLLLLLLFPLLFCRREVVGELELLEERGDATAANIL